SFYVGFGTLLVLSGLLLQQPLFRLLHLSDAAASGFLFVLFASAISNIAAMFLSVFKGIQRMDKSNSLEVTLSVVNAAGTVCFLEAGWGVLGLSVNALLNSCFAVLLTGWTVHRVIPKIRLTTRFDGRLLRDMLAYGLKMQISSIGGLVCFQVPKLI